MRVLFEPNSATQHLEIVELLLAHGIPYREVAGGFLGPAALWVEESDLERARELAWSVDARHTRQAREEWEQEWRRKYQGSYLRWLAYSGRQPGNWLRLIVLLAMLFIFAVYPLLHVFRP